MPKAKKETTFEQDLEKLEGIVAALEDGGLPLDAALAQFEEGIKLARACETALTEAEKKIEILVKNAAGELEAKPFAETREASETDQAPPPPKHTNPQKTSAAENELDGARDPYEELPPDDDGDDELLF